MSEFITNGELRIEAERLADENEKLRKLLRAMWVRVRAEYPRGGFPDMGIFADELAYLGIGGER